MAHDYFSMSPKEADAFDLKQSLEARKAGKRFRPVGRNFSDCGHKSERM